MPAVLHQTESHEHFTENELRWRPLPLKTQMAIRAQYEKRIARMQPERRALFCSIMNGRDWQFAQEAWEMVQTSRSPEYDLALFSGVCHIGSRQRAHKIKA